MVVAFVNLGAPCVLDGFDGSVNDEHGKCT